MKYPEAANRAAMVGSVAERDNDMVAVSAGDDAAKLGDPLVNDALAFAP
jgi:hypothetical protein